MDIGNLIRTKRIEKGLTIKQLAELVGVSESAVSRWETGNISNMRRDRIFNLSKAIDVPYSALLSDGDNFSELSYLPKISKEAFQIAQAYESANEEQKQIIKLVLKDLL